MQRPSLFILFSIVIAMPLAIAAQSRTSDVTPLGNKDVVLMVEHRLETESIVKLINDSACTFDTFPPVLREMERRGVPKPVLQAMLDAPYGPSRVTGRKDDLGEQPILHYTEQLKQLGLLVPFSSRGQSASRRARVTRSRQHF